MSESDILDTMIAEAGSNPKGLTAVAYTIANRSSQRGLSPTQVVKQHGQYAGYSNPGSASKAAQKDAKVRAQAKAIWDAVQAGSIPDPTNGGTDFRAASASGVLGNNVVNIGGNVFKLGNAQSPLIPQSAVAAIQAAAPIPQPRPLAPEVNAYADPVASPPLPIPRPSYPTGGSSTLMPFAGGLTAQPQGAGDSWGPESGRWGPSNFSNAFPSVPVPQPSQALTSHSVHTVAIDPMTGNPITTLSLQDALNTKAAQMAQSIVPQVTGRNSPVTVPSFVSEDHPLSNAVASPAPKTIYYNSTAGNVALPQGVVPASVTHDLASITGQQMNSSGSPDDRQSSPIAPTPLPSRPAALNAPYIPGPSGYSSSNKDSSSLVPSAPLSFGSSVNDLPAVQAATQAVSKPTTTYTYKQMQESNPAYEKYIAAQNADDIGAGPGSFADLQSALGSTQSAPPKYITKTVAIPHVPVPSTAVPLSTYGTVNPLSQIVPQLQAGFNTTPAGHLTQLATGQPIQGGLLGLLFGNSTPLAGLLGNGAPRVPNPNPQFPNYAGGGAVTGQKQGTSGYTIFNGDNGVPSNSGNWFNEVTGRA